MLAPALAAHDVEQPLLAELLTVRVQRVRHAVGVQHQHVARAQVEPVVLQRDLVEGAENNAALCELGQRSVSRRDRAAAGYGPRC